MYEMLQQYLKMGVESDLWATIKRSSETTVTTSKVIYVEKHLKIDLLNNTYFLKMDTG